MDELAEVISELQAAQIAQSRVLQALIETHPAPKALKETWLRYGSPVAASAATDAAMKDRAADRALLYHLDRWSQRIEAASQRVV